jgi:glycine cleavage system regulatory protein
VEGVAVVGETLTATITPSGATASYQWMRSDSEDKDGTYTNISGATEKTYKLVAADVGKYIKVKATGTGDYKGTVESKPVGPVVAVTGELVPATDYPGYDSWKDAITEEGIDFGQITKDQAIAMGLPGVDYYGVAMYLEVDGEQVDLSADNLESVVRTDPAGGTTEPTVSGDNIYQFVHDGWGGPGEYTMLYTLKDGTIIEAKINVVSFEFKDEKPHVPMEVTAEVGPFTVGVQQEFIVKTVANDDAGRMVRAYFDIPAGVAVEYQEQNPAHPDYGKWFPLEGVFGPSTGFPVMDVDDSKFRATFDTAGDYSITIEFKEVDTGEVLATYVMEVTVNEKPHIPMEVTAEVGPFTVGVQQEFIVKTVANDDAGRMVRAYFDIPAGVAVEYQEQNPAHPDYGKWFPLEGVFGPSTGFPVMDVDDSKFRATFDTAGDYSITIEFKEVDTGEVLATYVMEVTVNEKPHIPMEVTAEVGPFTVGVQQEFIVKTVANDDAGRMVRAYFDIPAGVAVEYQEQNPAHPDYGKWFPLEGVFGPSTGFPVMDVDDSKFRATFDTAGDYSITIEFKEVDTGEVLATYVMEVTVNEKPHIPMEVTAEVGPFTVGVQQEFIVKTVANDDAGRMVRAYFDIPAGVAVEYRSQRRCGSYGQGLL